MSTADTSTETSADIRPGTAIRDPLADHLITPQNSALILIDYQPEQVKAVRLGTRRDSGWSRRDRAHRAPAEGMSPEVPELAEYLLEQAAAT